MASEQSSALYLRFPHWQGEYEAALRETDQKALFKRVEVAEAALLNRRDALRLKSGGKAEQKEVERAIERVRVIKKDILDFPD